MDIKHLNLMANQIARNFAVQGEDAAIAATAQHLVDFWDPRMKAAIVADDGAGLDPIARAAVAKIGVAKIAAGVAPEFGLPRIRV